MEIVQRKISDLIPYENNPRHNEKTVQLVANSIKEFGFKVPIVIDKNNVIVAGHTRLKASRLLGIAEVPCIVADDLTEEQIKAYRLADNKVAEQSEWIDNVLDLELMDISIDMSQFGFEIETEEEKAKKEKEKMIQSMELKAFEHHDYIVFYFKDQLDWLNVVNEFGIKKVDAGYGNTKKIGVGRVIDGARLLEKIRHTNSDIKQR